MDDSAFMFELSKDAIWARNVMKAATPGELQQARRAFVRAAFAMLEGTLFVFQSTLLRSPEKLSHAEVLALNEVSVVVHDGVVGERPQFVELKEKVRLVFRLFARIFEPEFKPDFRSPDWQAFLGAIKVRHRLVPPKSLTEMAVSEADVETVEKAIKFCTGHLLGGVLLVALDVDPKAALGLIAATGRALATSGAGGPG